MRGILTIAALLFTCLIAGTALAQEAPAGPPYRVGGEVSRPEKVSGDPPAYTEMARRARITGVVIVEAVIDEQGNVLTPRVLKGLPMGLDEQVVDAVQTWKFKPATFHGKAVPVYYILTINFQVDTDLSFGQAWSGFLAKTPELAEPFRAKRYEEATALLDRWIAERPKDATLHFARSYVLMAQGRMDEAMAEAKVYDGPDAGELFYDLALNTSNRAEDEQDPGDLVDLGLEAVDRALELRPDDPDALLVKVGLLRGKASLLSDDDEEAQALRDEADRLDKRVYELRVKKQPKKGT
ncbi:MAG TPA: TonB family protein [Thermoanaerobaculia bacterium]|jgi:TonB family protein|nr:TonB family protein [Thermoanaerobaculia bacterium]